MCCKGTTESGSKAKKKKKGGNKPADPVKNTLFPDSSTRSSTCVCSVLSISFVCRSSFFFFSPPPSAGPSFPARVDSPRRCCSTFLRDARLKSLAVISHGSFGTSRCAGVRSARVLAVRDGGAATAAPPSLAHGIFRFFFGTSGSSSSSLKSITSICLDVAVVVVVVVVILCGGGTGCCCLCCLAVDTCPCTCPLADTGIGSSGAKCSTGDEDHGNGAELPGNCGCDDSILITASSSSSMLSYSLFTGAGGGLLLLRKLGGKKLFGNDGGVGTRKLAGEAEYAAGVSMGWDSAEDSSARMMVSSKLRSWSSSKSPSSKKTASCSAVSWDLIFGEVLLVVVEEEGGGGASSKEVAHSKALMTRSRSRGLGRTTFVAAVVFCRTVVREGPWEAVAREVGGGAWRRVMLGALEVWGTLENAWVREDWVFFCGDGGVGFGGGGPLGVNMAVRKGIGGGNDGGDGPWVGAAEIVIAVGVFVDLEVMFVMLVMSVMVVGVGVGVGVVAEWR